MSVAERTENLNPSQPAPQLEKAILLDKPSDVPDGFIAYNPSGIWKTKTKQGEVINVMYARVEPDRSDGVTSHLGKTVARPYMINLSQAKPELIRYEAAPDIPGEDAFLTKVNRRLASGKIKKVWLLGVVDAQPMPDAANDVASLQTRFYAGDYLENLEHIADGPPWMKDVRVVQGPNADGTELVVYGRPQPLDFSGNITSTILPNLEALNEKNISDAPYIDENLLPVGSGVWGGVNDAVHIGGGKYVLAAHRAWRTGEDGASRHYEAVLYQHDITTKSIREIGVLATADMFPEGQVKDDAKVHLNDVVFTGGGYNGGLSYITFGVRDATIGLAQTKH